VLRRQSRRISLRIHHHGGGLNIGVISGSMFRRPLSIHLHDGAGLLHRQRGCFDGNRESPVLRTEMRLTIMVWGSPRHPASIPGSVTRRLAPHHDGPIAGASVTQHPLRLNLLLLASWPHARFHPCRCSPDNPDIWKGWRCFVFSVGGIIGQKIA
jgi:hypothetical protein